MTTEAETTEAEALAAHGIINSLLNAIAISDPSIFDKFRESLKRDLADLPGEHRNGAIGAVFKRTILQLNPTIQTIDI